MYAELITPDKTLFQGEVKLLKLPGKKGSFQILQNHAPIISSLDKGDIDIEKEDGERISFEIKSGIIECKSNRISILVNQ
ncbi:MAG: ATP synthase F1 subunit epsilon [Marinifilaceae bacterium]|jgi:F-type H+-transporting ATPase subunit epsilon|nr:ATP synthase F1 subunit epsilon [Marinifilaceae bacterium]